MFISRDGVKTCTLYSLHVCRMSSLWVGMGNNFSVLNVLYTSTG
jgi:hypothetical protein